MSSQPSVDDQSHYYAADAYGAGAANDVRASESVVYHAAVVGGDKEASYGRPPPPPTTTTTPNAASVDDDDDDDRAEVQPPRFRDWPYAVLFYAHLIAVLIATLVNVPIAFRNMAVSAQDAVAFNDDNDNDYGANDDGDDGDAERRLSTSRSLQEANNDAYVDPQFPEYDESGVVEIDVDEILFVVTVSVVVGLVVAGASLPVLVRWPRVFCRASLRFMVVAFVALAAVGFGTSSGPVAFCGVAGTALSAWFVCDAWESVPLVASNARAAATAVRERGGVLLAAYASAAVLGLWSVWWSVAAASTLYVVAGCRGLDCDLGSADDDGVDGAVVASLIVVATAFLLSFVWTHQVVKNTVRVTVAGAVGAWWFDPAPSAAFCCGGAVRASLGRALTHAFGSVCLGSSVVAIVGAVRDASRRTRRLVGDAAIVGPAADATARWAENLADRYNRLAFCVVGIYGYDLAAAGVWATNLLRRRVGRTEEEVRSHLADRVLFAACAGAAFVVGTVAVVVARTRTRSLSGWGVFVIGAASGLATTDAVVDVVGSAVDAVVVLFAEAPEELRRNRPELERSLRESWREARLPSDLR